MLHRYMDPLGNGRMGLEVLPHTQTLGYRACGFRYLTVQVQGGLLQPWSILCFVAWVYFSVPWCFGLCAASFVFASSLRAAEPLRDSNFRTVTMWWFSELGSFKRTSK